MTETQPVSASQLRVMPTASGHNVLLSRADFDLYHLHVTRFFTHYRPEGQMESEFVQRLADTEWRINRIARLEMSLYAHGQVEFAGLFANEDGNVQTLLLEAHAHQVYARQLKELSVQESRLRRYFEKDQAALADLQTSRESRESREREVSPPQEADGSTVTAAQHVQAAPAPSHHSVGFEFSNAPSRSTTHVKTPAPALANGQLNPRDR